MPQRGGARGARRARDRWRFGDRACPGRGLAERVHVVLAIAGAARARCARGIVRRAPTAWAALDVRDLAPLRRWPTRCAIGSYRFPVQQRRGDVAGATDGTLPEHWATRSTSTCAAWPTASRRLPDPVGRRSGNRQHGVGRGPVPSPLAGGYATTKHAVVGLTSRPCASRPSASASGCRCSVRAWCALPPSAGGRSRTAQAARSATTRSCGSGSGCDRWRRSCSRAARSTRSCETAR